MEETKGVTGDEGNTMGLTMEAKLAVDTCNKLDMSESSSEVWGVPKNSSKNTDTVDKDTTISTVSMDKGEASFQHKAYDATMLSTLQMA